LGFQTTGGVKFFFAGPTAPASTPPLPPLCTMPSSCRLRSRDARAAPPVDACPWAPDPADDRGRRRPDATVRAMMWRWRWRGVLACNFSPRFFLPGLGRSSLSCNLKRGCMPLLARCYSEPAGGPWRTRLKRVVISCRPPRAFARRFAGRGEKAGWPRPSYWILGSDGESSRKF